jgi:hypothetical protein
MPKATHSSPETLYHHWRKGDASAGQALAQRFTDWYFAIAATRLGEEAGDVPFRAACKKFSKGVASVDDARRLLGWAHGIAVKQIHATTATGRVGDGDLSNNFSRKASPKQILLKARAALPHEMHLLENAYLGRKVTDLQQVLNARYEVKSWLRTHLDLPFKVLPNKPDPDCAPMVLYEAGRLANEAEDTTFELYMLADVEVCQDVAEFAHFAIALRGGLPGEIPAAGRVRQAAAQPAAAEPAPLPAAAKRADAAPPPAPPATQPSMPIRPVEQVTTAGLKAVVRPPPPPAGRVPVNDDQPTGVQSNATFLAAGMVILAVVLVGIYWVMSGGAG